MSIKLDVTKRIEWLKKRMTITELDEEYIRFQIMEAMMEALEKGQSLPIDSVSHQRELLKSFCKYIDLESRAHHDDIKIDIENHLKIFNCG